MSVPSPILRECYEAERQRADRCLGIVKLALFDVDTDKCDSPACKPDQLCRIHRLALALSKLELEYGQYAGGGSMPAGQAQAPAERPAISEPRPSPPEPAQEIHWVVMRLHETLYIGERAIGQIMKLNGLGDRWVVVDMRERDVSKWGRSNPYDKRGARQALVAMAAQAVAV